MPGLNEKYEIIVGLEVHAELSTETKIYCACKNSFGAEVNTQCCEICTGLPGTLPTLNEKVVEYAVRMGLAANCKINNITKQDRKNYFYPDLPKAYQISQYDVPLCQNGWLDFLVDGEERRVGITRIHIEEDAGKLLHGESFSGSLVDFNRCGVPLIEIVSEPDIRSSKEAKAYLETLKQILVYLGVSDGKMQEGSIRCDVNVSVRLKGQEGFNNRVEMKNVNTFSGAARAIDYEAARQSALMEAGETVGQETRRWDDVKGENILLRSKENAMDYRYFPEPDLKTIVVDDSFVSALKEGLPELPNRKTARYMREYGLPAYDAGLLAESMDRAAFFERAAALGLCQPKNISNWLLGDITYFLREKKMELSESAVTPEKLADMVSRLEKGEISGAAAKIVAEALLDSGLSAGEIISEKGLAQVSDRDALESIVDAVLADSEKAVIQYKSGKTNVLGFLVGQCMKRSKGKGNPAVLSGIIAERLK
ncbi:MAG: Asp-tRNA(Asn)/Glu-tRNA(Gln) amidotransferase subunit GatB [Oscillospiraceae bacterium]|jgi:aspartyl-tRNA(Asn)/glutamyl-tRNA(Gln) amidotransferase subunit B|nr:Asp-tRNA(Asn)/Glu-tRNA(Gln) amidotransferase subunit GatB [Oscillospiraceae bacterium]